MESLIDYKVGQGVTVDTCGGRFNNKIVKIHKNYLWSEETHYETLGQSLTTTRAEFLNVEGKQICHKHKCSFKRTCKFYQTKTEVN